jgi:UDP-N-acetylglucosamine diphosphorylase/glucosamine-1-phosphate N-acetyltransferase
MWNTSQLINDPQIVQQMLPLTYTRELKELMLGLSPIESKWKACAHKIPEDCWILGSCLPTDSLIEALSTMDPSYCLTWNGQWIAYRAKNEMLPNELPPQALQEKPIFISYPEECIALNDWALRNEIQAKPFDITQFATLETRIIAPESCEIHPSASIHGSILDASLGPIFIGPDVNIQIGTLIQGPVAFLAGSSTNVGAKIRPNTTIGEKCKIGGEVSATIFYPYTNKSHDGFVGNSVIGSYCNWGAMTTSSNVRNDLKPIDLYDYTKKNMRATQLKSFGVLMGDFVTTGIHTKLNTGTVISSHSNISGPDFLPKFIPAFTWGEYPQVDTYRFEEAKRSAIAWIKAKNQEIPENLDANMREIWKAEAKDRN